MRAGNNALLQLIASTATARLHCKQSYPAADLQALASHRPACGSPSSICWMPCTCG